MIAGLLIAACKGTATTSSGVPQASALRDGDLIFQESTSSQSQMVSALTGSRWTHVGVVMIEPSGVKVLEAASPVRKTALARFIAHGQGGRYVLKRLRDADTRLTPEVSRSLKQVAAGWLGRPYDARFGWDDDTLYCSELVYKLFERAAAIRLGKLERASDMNLDHPLVQRAIQKRFAEAKLDPSETIVTPDSIFNDEQLVEVRPHGFEAKQ